MKRLAFIPDCHIPYHHPEAFATAVRAIKGFKPDVLVLLGDFLDFFALSFHEREPGRRRNLQAEFDAGNAALDVLDAIGAGEKHYILGNHEHRLARYLANNAGELEGLRSLSLGNQLHLRERGWKVTPYKQHLRLGKLLVSHDFERSGPKAAEQAVTDVMGNAIIGHVHAARVSYSGNAVGEVHVGASFGWLGDPKHTDYRHQLRATRDWAHAFGVGYQLPGGDTWVQAVPIVNGRCVVEGKVYR